jgi:hypothetical protein
MVPRLVEGGCLYCTLGGPGPIPVEAVRASNVLYHGLVLLVCIPLCILCMLTPLPKYMIVRMLYEESTPGWTIPISITFS